MIAVINESTVLSDAEVQSYLPAYQIQVNRDFGPVWGMAAQLQFVPKADIASVVDDWQLVFLDGTSQAGVLGYHDLTSAGKPMSKIFAATDLQYGSSVSVTGSHELLEMLGDPSISLGVSQTDAQGNIQAIFPYEACDACEADSYGYEINGILVSDFVYPAWFGGISEKRFDFKEHCSAAGVILSGGYIGKWTPAGGWTQIVGAAAQKSPAAAIVPGSRRERRIRGHANWVRSESPTVIASRR